MCIYTIILYVSKQETNDCVHSHVDIFMYRYAND